MKLQLHALQHENDFWRIRNFLREVFLLNGCREHSWHVARLDYWRWHFILNGLVCDPIEKVTMLWEAEQDQIVAVLHAVDRGSIRLQTHPHFRTPALEDEMLAYAEEHLSAQSLDGSRVIYVPVLSVDTSRQQVLAQRGYTKTGGFTHHWMRDLEQPLLESLIPTGYILRSMGDLSEHPARSWASWRAFHADELETNYDGDWSWYQNIQAAPLYRRDLDIIAAAPDGSIAAFCTIYYDDYTRSAVSVLVGTAAEHWRRGLGKAVMFEGMRRLKKLGCTRLFANAYDPPADALYGSALGTKELSETWCKES